MYRVFFEKGVPREELEAVIALLQRERIDFYQTPRENFGGSTAAIWVKTERDYRQARRLIEDYQKTLHSTGFGNTVNRANRIVWLAVATLFLLMLVLIGVR